MAEEAKVDSSSSSNALKRKLESESTLVLVNNSPVRPQQPIQPPKFSSNINTPSSTPWGIPQKAATPPRAISPQSYATVNTTYPAIPSSALVYKPQYSLHDPARFASSESYWRSSSVKAPPITAVSVPPIPDIRLKRLVQMDKSITCEVDEDILQVIAKATELFIQALAEKAYQETRNGKRKILQYKDIAKVVKENDNLLFMLDEIPEIRKQV